MFSEMSSSCFRLALVGQNGRREGVGAFSYSNGARYEGTWVADQKHGLGKFKSEAGTLYEGKSGSAQTADF